MFRTGAPTSNSLFIYYEQAGWHLNPDLVLLAFCMSNDIMGNHERFSSTNKPTLGIRDGQIVQFEFPERCDEEQGSTTCDFEGPSTKYEVSHAKSFQLRSWCKANLHTFHYIRNAANRIPVINRALIQMGMREEVHFIHQIFMADEPAVAGKAWTVTKSILDRLHRSVEQDGANACGTGHPLAGPTRTGILVRTGFSPVSLDE